MKLLSKSIIFIGIVVLLLVAAVYYFDMKEEKITDPIILRIKESGKIIVGTDATYQPMEYTDENGKIIGLDVDIANEIASKIGVSVEIKNVVWDKIFNSLKNGEIDLIISSVTITPERSQEMLFSDPYFNAGQTIVMLESNQDIKSPLDLRGKKVGVQKGTTSETEALKYTDSSLVVPYDNYELTSDDLKTGKIDAIIIDYPAGVGLTKKTTDLKVLNDPFTQEFYGIAIRKSEQGFLTEVNKALRDLKQTGKLKEIEDRWL